jgi:hypothetical protein
MQTQYLKILALIIISTYSWAQETPVILNRADSLFYAKQYTQSFRFYDSLIKEKKYSAAMLLKMAYIKEGLGQPGRSLYYLNLYLQATDDDQAATKMEELADKHRLEGYASSESAPVKMWIKKNNSSITMLLAAFVLLSFGWLVYQKRKRETSVLPLALLIPLSIILAWFANWEAAPTYVIVSQPKTYLMSGPSGGASVTAILDEGHRFAVTGKQDVWLRVKWREKDVFIKQSHTTTASL